MDKWSIVPYATHRIAEVLIVVVPVHLWVGGTQEAIPCVRAAVLRSRPPVTNIARGMERTTAVAVAARKGREPAGIGGPRIWAAP